MRKATLVRYRTDDDGTFGDFLSDSGFRCKIGELPWRDDKPNISCVSARTALMKMMWSEKHQRNLYHMRNLDGSEISDHTNIEQHGANLMGDVAKGKVSQLLGCQAPGAAVATFSKGTRYSQEAPALPADQLGVTGSDTALKALMADLGDEYELEIKWADGINPEGQEA